MESVTFNRSDWSGKEMTIQVDRDTLSWEQDGYKFQLEKVEDFVDDEVGLSMETYKCIGDAWDRPLFNLTKFSTDSVWWASSMGVERDHADPVICAAQIICNTV